MNFPTKSIACTAHDGRHFLQFLFNVFIGHRVMHSKYTAVMSGSALCLRVDSSLRQSITRFCSSSGSFFTPCLATCSDDMSVRIGGSAFLSRFWTSIGNSGTLLLCSVLIFFIDGNGWDFLDRWFSSDWTAVVDVRIFRVLVCSLLVE